MIELSFKDEDNKLYEMIEIETIEKYVLVESYYFVNSFFNFNEASNE